MLDQPGELAMAPNGNGGVYVSLRDSGLLASLEADGVSVPPPLAHKVKPLLAQFQMDLLKTSDPKLQTDGTAQLIAPAVTSLSLARSTSRVPLPGSPCRAFYFVW